MGYQETYDLLIERGKNRILKGYSEGHHIVPKCMGGSNKKENLIRLTGEEHFEAHQLLRLIYPKNKGLNTAMFLMLGKRKKKGKKIDAKEYERLRKRHARVMSEQSKGPMPEEIKEKLRKPRPNTKGPRGPMPEEWKKNMRKPKGPMPEWHKEKLRKPQNEEQKINNGKAHRKPILCTTNGIIYSSTKEAAEKLRLRVSGIWSVLNGKYKHTGGYTFEYVNKV